MSTPCPIYTVGNGKRTHLAMRADGQWFVRRHDGRLGWGKWDKCARDLYQFDRYITPRAGNARLPNE